MNPKSMDELRNLTLKDAVVAVTTHDLTIDDTIIRYSRGIGRKPFLLSFRKNPRVRSGSIIEDDATYRQFFTLDDILNNVSLGTSSTPEEAKNTFGYFLLLYSLGVARAESMAASHLVLPSSILPTGSIDIGRFYHVLQNLTNEGTSRDTKISVKLMSTEGPKSLYVQRNLSPDQVVTLISGGTDSVGVSFMAHRLGRDVLPVQVIYDQSARHQELWCVDRVAEDLGIKVDDLCRVSLPVLKNFGASGLLRDDVQINEQNTTIEYVPFRNTVLLAVALMRAELAGAKYVVIGANCDDTLAPDGTPAYIRAINDVIQAVDAPVPSVIAPLLRFGGKPEIIRTGKDLGVDFSHTWSCHAYIPPQEVGLDAKACGTCGNCATRYSAFDKLGLKDPIAYNQIPKLRTRWAGPQENYEPLRTALGLGK
ncbi:MAG TPA: 7-cyano-7-deazaguanine synthase [Candidatus Nanoarchaeia archaeon]|nr:7-cyano-7-deazaguanine synthase [Candidatus Nanoarchaeia archaeon]